ncbi:MAG: cell envelope integrity protein CreD [Bacteroidales bacterium]
MKNRIYVKLGAIILLIFLFMIPRWSIKDLVRERVNLSRDTQREVSSKWANSQVLTGPYMSIPFSQILTDKDGVADISTTKKYIHLMPKAMNVKAIMNPEIRKRSIYKVLLYNSVIDIDGAFDLGLLSILINDEMIVHWNEASINLGLSDLRGIEKEIIMDVNGDSLLSYSGLSDTDVASRGIHIPFPIDTNVNIYNYSTQILLKGSSKWSVIPVAKNNTIELKSSHPSPSFVGAFLPDYRKVCKTGFEAKWNILSLNLDYPSSWIGDQYKITENSVGTRLLSGVNNYDKVNRAIKYSSLFIVLTFTLLFFIEIMKRTPIHPIHYILIGINLVLFFILLLSLSEFVSFNLSYGIATILTISMISLFAKSITKSFQLSAFLFGVLFLVYGFIFVIMQLEYFSLLVGSLGLVFILGIVMYYSRKIDWYGISKELKEKHL